MSEKIAVLDTDFIIKTIVSQNSKNESLIETVMKLPYKFYCHKQNQIELTDKSEQASKWLQDNIKSGKVKCLSDKDLVLLVKNSYSISFEKAVRIFAENLQQSCNVFSSTFFPKHYYKLKSLSECKIITNEEFSRAMKSGNDSVGKGNNLGEIKDTLLVMILKQCINLQCFHFCSDDKKARRNLLSYSQNYDFPLKSISFIGFFWIAKQKKLLTQKEESEFLFCWKSFCIQNKIGTNITMKENIYRKQPDYPKVDIDILFKDIWADNLIMTNDGFLVYKTEVEP